MGTNSIGWCLFEATKDGDVTGVVKSGVRIFSDGREPKGNHSLNEKRRAARLQRRQRDRFLQRKSILMNALISLGLMPKEESERKKLEVLDPYRLRRDAIEKQIHLHEIGRLLFHINQRRGFKSNRKVFVDEGADGPVSASISDFKEKLDGKTVGAYLHEMRDRGHAVRARRKGTKKEDLYPYYADREMLLDEFNRIWEKQSSYSDNSDVFTDAVKERLRAIIFDQRDLKRPIVGKCLFFNDEDRVAKASPLFQKFRIIQEINNIRYLDQDQWRELPTDLRKEFIDKLLNRQNALTVDKIKKRIMEVQETTWLPFLSQEHGIKDKIEGDQTRVSFTRSRKGKNGQAFISKEEYYSWGTDKQVEFVNLFLSMRSDDELRKELKDAWSIPNDVASDLICVRLPQGHGNLCEKAIRLLLPHLEDGKRYDEAIEIEGLDKFSEQKYDAGSQSKLPNYNQHGMVRKWCLPRSQKDESDPTKWRIPNPTVHVALNQLRNVVNDVLKRMCEKDDSLDRICVEVARELPKGAVARGEILSNQKKAREENERRNNELEKHKVSTNYNNRMLLRLWEDQGHTCPYSLKNIGVSSLFTPDVEIDHILPFSRTLDNGVNNKVVCISQHNRAKRNKTPFEAYSQNSNWQAILQNAHSHSSGLHRKAWRFEENAMKEWEENHKFFDRQLPETQYITRVAIAYLKSVATEVIPITGRHTSDFRRWWQLQSVLGDDRTKNRHDHRNHAIDAAVVGSISRGMMQKMAAAAENGSGTRPFYERPPQPFEDYRNEIKKSIKSIVVSHKAKKWKGGQLHDETAMGFPATMLDDEDVFVTWKKVPLTDMKTEKKIREICSGRIKTDLLELRKGASDKEYAEKLEHYAKNMQIRRVKIERRFDKKNLLFVKDKMGIPFKAYLKRSNWCCEIYPKPSGKWASETITRISANNPEYVPDWKRTFPDAKMVMRIFINDMLVQHLSDGKKRFYVVQKISTGGQITLFEHYQANTDQRNRSKDDAFKFTYKEAASIQTGKFDKCEISAGGLIRIIRRNSYE